MSSTSKYSKYRTRLKETNPEKYQEQLRKAKERSKRNREARKNRWASEPQTRGLQQEIDDFKEKARKRWREYYTREKLKEKRATRNSLQASEAARPSHSKRPKDMTPDELREHKRKLKELSRKRETPKKTWWRRKKDREHKQAQRAKTKGSQQADASQCQPSSHPTCSPVKKSEYNLVSSWRRILNKKTPSKFAKLLSNLARNTKCQQQKAAAQASFVTSQHESSQKKYQRLLAATKRKFLTKKQRKERKDALSSDIKMRIRAFYLREDISRALPSKRYATKHGPGYVMQQTLRQAHKLFRLEHPGMKVGYTKFTRLRPKNVRKISAAFLETCQCVYCLNVRLKVLALNRLIGRDTRLDKTLKVEDERALYNLLLCKKADNKQFHDLHCITGKCQKCSKFQDTLGQHYGPLLELNPTVSWSKWTRDSGGREPAVATGTVKDLFDELVLDVEAPCKSVTFVQHLFVAHWQHHQYRELKKTLKAGQVLVIMDFAENKKSQCQDEIKSAHFNKKQFSFHPVVAFYRAQDGDLVRHALDFVTDDVTHDYHSVHHFTIQTIQYFTEQGILHPGCELYVFSDNCAAQYKCRGVFADLSMYKEPVQRLYFGAEHGKGEADGETGAVSKKVETAVLCRQVQIRGAQDFFHWCQENMEKDTPKSKRHFVFIQSEDINRDRPESEVKTVAGSRKFHQVLRVAPMVVKSRHLACFCSPCLAKHFDACINADYVGRFEMHKLQPSQDQSSPPSPQPQPTISRESFFRSLQRELELARKKGFGAFVACAQNGMRRAKDYPLPSHDTQPEFPRDQVDNIAEQQRPAGSAPSGYFAKQTPAFGDCLVQALSAAAFGTEDFQLEIRVRLACELAMRKYQYLSPEYVARGSEVDGRHSLAMFHASGDFQFLPSIDLAFDGEVMKTISSSRELGMWHLLAAANVLQARVWSIYPTMDPALHRQCLPDEEPRFDIYVQWTSMQEDSNPCHFVPVVKAKQEHPTVRVGEYVLADFFSGDGNKKSYRGVVVARPEWMCEIDSDVCVSCMREKENGRYWVFPSKEEICSVPLQHINKCKQPTMNNRGHFFF